MRPEKLIALAKEAMAYAYAPYSGYHVGAALLCADGRVFTGCNIENAAYGPTNCAERTAVFKAVSEGHQHFKRIAIAAATEQFCPPCGVCRQVMREFVGDDFVVYMGGAEGYTAMTMTELLPAGFKASEHMA